MLATYQSMRRQVSNVDSDDSKRTEQKPAFLYNSWIFVPFMPCFVVLLSLSGQWFLFFFAVGGLFVHVIDNSGQKKMAVLAVIVTFLLCQITVLYSVLPLIWNSLFYIVLIFFTNIITVLSAGWILLQFPVFIQNHIAIAKTVESLLFSLYPSTAASLLTWLAAVMINIHIAPFCFLIIGFVLYQMFLIPSPPSFNNDSLSNKRENILVPSLVGIMGIFYCIVPGIIFVCGNLWLNLGNIFHVDFLTQLILIISASMYLTSYLITRKYLERYMILPTSVTIIRLANATVILLSISCIAKHLDPESTVLPWLLPGLGLHAVYGVMLDNNYSQNASMLSGVMLVSYYAFVLVSCPWKAIIVISSAHIPLSAFYLALVSLNINGCNLLGLSACSDILCFGRFSIFHTVGFMTCEGVLVHVGLYPFSMICATSTLAVYTTIRLHGAQKISTKQEVILLCIHICKPIMFYGILAFASVFPLAMLVTKIIALETSEYLSSKQLMAYNLAIGLCLILNIPTSMVLWSKTTHNSTSYLHLIVYAQIIWSLLYMKITLPKKEHFQGWIRQMGPIALCSAILNLLLLPEISFSKSSIIDWSLQISLIASFLSITDCLKVRTKSQRLILSGLIGCPMAWKAIILLYDPTKQTLFLWIMVSFAGNCLADVAHKIFTCNVSDLGNYLINMTCALFVIGVCILMPGLWSITSAHELCHLPALRLLIIMCGLPAILIKVHSLTDRALDLSVKGGYKSSKLPLIGNLYTLHLFIFLCLACPIGAWDAWICGVHICLHRTGHIRPSLESMGCCIFTHILSSYEGLNHHATSYQTESRSPNHDYIYICSISFNHFEE
ncbi:uncharacterized protein LOC141900300 [Tubulanus polymorphus]|uniref:uncharacterized protein LOC141900300 n=1 Tax=Tubulanus polymorphus TaxID=672921 RepID=UPI003DA43BEB